MAFADISQTSFSSITDYETLVDEYEVRSIQLDRGTLHGWHSEIRFPDLIVRRFTTNRAMEDTCFFNSGWTTFAMPSRPEVAPVTWCGCKSRPEFIGVLRPNREQHFCMPAGWDGIEIEVPDTLLIDEGLMPEQLLMCAMNPTSAQLPALDDVHYSFVKWLASLLCDVERLTAIHRNPDIATRLRRHILGSLADIIDNGLSRSDARSHPRPLKRYTLVRRAQAKIEEHLPDCPNIESMAPDLGCSSRALERAFRDVLGVSPYQYQLRRRLDTARRDLCNNVEARTILDIAGRHGFTSGSQFSLHYQRMFRENPSNTLQSMSKA